MKTMIPAILELCFITVFMCTGIRSTFAYDPEKDNAPYYMTGQELDKMLGVEAKTNMRDGYVRVLYFHRTPGCPTCQTMSKYVYETVLKTYPEEVRKRQIVLRYYDFEDPKNATLVKTFKVASPSLVLVQGRNGKDVKAKKANRIWSLAGDKAAFMEYVGKEIGEYLKSTEQQGNK